MDPSTAIFLAQSAKELGKAFGPDIIKAIWAKISGDNSQDAKLKKVSKKLFQETQRLQQIRNDFTEYANLQEVLSPNYKGPKQWPAIQKQQQKRFNNLQKTVDKYYQEFPALKKKVSESDYNSVQDLLKEEIKGTEKKAEDAVQAIKEGKDVLQGQVVQPGTADQQRFQQYTPEQQQAMSELLRSGLGDIQSKKFDFAPIEEEARAGFKQKTIPTIAERFTQLNAQKSSAFPQLLSQAGADLERSLAGMKQGYNLQQQGNLANLMSMGLRPQYAHAGPLIGGMPQQGSNIDKFAEVLPGLLGGAGDFISKLFAKKDATSQAQGQQLSNLQNKVGGSYQALQAIYPEAFKGKTVLPEAYSPGKVTNMQALKALYPQAFGDAGVSDQNIQNALAGLGQNSL